MNEGLSDYFSSAITGDPDVGEYASQDFAAGLARHPHARQQRQAARPALVGEVHFDSTLFSGALWQARVSLPEARSHEVRRGALQGDATNPGRADLGFGDLAKLFLGDADDRSPCGEAALETAMKSRGILPSCERILEFTGTAIESAEPRFGFAAPGKQAVALRGIAPGLSRSGGAAQGHPVGDVKFTARSGGAGAGNPLGGQATPFAPVVLAKFGKPITWDVAAKAAHDAD